MTAAHTSGLPAPRFGVISGGQGGAQAPSGLVANVPGTSGIYVSSDGGKATYRGAAVGQTLYSTAAAVLVELQGSATATIRVKRLAIWAQAGTKFFTELELLRSTTISGTGTPTAVTPGQHDVNDAAATAVLNYYTAAATFGTGHLISGAIALPISPPAAGAVGPQVGGWNFCQADDKAFILRGTSDVLQVYNTITGLGTATFGFEVEWEEDLS